MAKGRKLTTPVGLSRTLPEVEAWLKRTRTDATKGQVVHTINNGEPIRATFNGSGWDLETEGWIHE